MQIGQVPQQQTEEVGDPEIDLTAGEILRQERLRIGLTENEVADHLHITKHYVRAIESDNYQKLPNAVFAKGYIKNYAIFLKLGIEDILERYQVLAIRQSELSQGATARRGLRLRDKNKLWVVLSVVVFICGFTGLWAFNYFIATGDSSRASEAPILNMTPLSPSNLDFNTAVTSLEEQADGTKTGYLPKEISQTMNEKPVTTTETGDHLIEITAAGNDVLSISFSGNSWVEINDVNENEIYRDIRIAGDVLKIQGISPFNILLGDASFAHLTFNGTEIDVSDQVRIDNSVRLTVGL